MFTEFGCGCISSANAGLVRLCSKHKPGHRFNKDDDKVVHKYPSHGQMVPNWSGK